MDKILLEHTFKTGDKLILRKATDIPRNYLGFYRLVLISKDKKSSSGLGMFYGDEFTKAKKEYNRIVQPYIRDKL